MMSVMNICVANHFGGALLTYVLMIVKVLLKFNQSNVEEIKLEYLCPDQHIEFLLTNNLQTDF